MKLDADVTTRLTALLAKGDSIYKTAKPGYAAGSDHCDKSQLAEWKAQAVVLLSAALGQDHNYVVAFRRAMLEPFTQIETDDVTIDAVERGQGILRAVLEDVVNGHLFTARTLIEAEVFTDFIEMALQLLTGGYKDPAASLAGAVLEDGLRRIARAKSVTFKPKAGIHELNEALSKVGVYNAIVMSRIESWRLIRNKADHGEFDEYNETAVKQMIDGVAEILGTYLV